MGINNLSFSSKVTTEQSEGFRDYDEKPVKSAFDPAGYDKELVEALERDILQKNPNVKWYVIVQRNPTHMHMLPQHSTKQCGSCE